LKRSAEGLLLSLDWRLDSIHGIGWRYAGRLKTLEGKSRGGAENSVLWDAGKIRLGLDNTYQLMGCCKIGLGLDHLWVVSLICHFFI
jgi:hypothetical protein